VLNGEATNTNFIVIRFDPIRAQSQIYHTRGEHPNQYTTDAVALHMDLGHESQECSDRTLYQF